jgi:hypothetical protein
VDAFTISTSDFARTFWPASASGLGQRGLQTFFVAGFLLLAGLFTKCVERGLFLRQEDMKVPVVIEWMTRHIMAAGSRNLMHLPDRLGE